MVPLERTALILMGMRTVTFTILVETVSKSEEYKLEPSNARTHMAMLLAATRDQISQAA